MRRRTSARFDIHLQEHPSITIAGRLADGGLLAPDAGPPLEESRPQVCLKCRPGPTRHRHNSPPPQALAVRSRACQPFVPWR